MFKTTSEDATIETLRNFVKKWGGILTMAGAGIGLFYQHKKGVDDLSVAIEQIRQNLRDRDSQYDIDHAVGADGFSDPRVKLALDQHIRAVLRAANAEQERVLSTWRKMLFELNPSIRKPPE